MDQFYFEEGYLEANYFTVFREAAASFTVTASQTAVVDIADTTGYYIPDYIATDYFEAGGQVREADAVFTVTAVQTAVVERILQAEATVAVTMTKSCTVTRIIDSTAAFTAAFAPTLTATAFKNHTAVLDSVSTMSVDAVANRSANVLLEHIADLNAMAAKTVDVTTNLSHTVSAVITANTNSSAQVTATSTVTLTADALNLQFASAAFTASAKILAVTSRNQYGRPITIVDNVNFNDTFVKYGTHAASRTNFSPISTTANANIRVTNQFVYEGWHRRASLNSGMLMAIGATGVVGGNVDIIGDNQWILATRQRQLNNATLFSMRLLVKNNLNQTQIFDSQESNDPNVYAAWMPTVNYSHWAVTRNSAGLMQVFKNGTEIISGTVTTMGTASEYRGWWGNLDTNTSSSRWDELSLRKKTSGITQAQQTDQPETQVFLFHLDNNLNDDTSNTINVTHSMASALVSTATLSAQANANTKQANADLSASVTSTAQGFKIQSASAALSSTSTLSVIIGSVKDSITLNAGVFTFTAQESRLRDAASSITSAFAPTLTATVTRGGDIALSTAFALTADANSFTDSGADIAAVFAVNCSPTVNFQAAGSLQSQTNINLLGGKLQLFQIDVNSALAFTVQAIGFEGTGVGLNTVSTLSVTARRLRTVVSAASSTFTQTTIGNNNPAPFEISDYEIFCSGWTFSAETAFSSNTPDSGQSLINVAIPKVATNPVPQLVGQISLVNGQGADTIFAPVTYLSRIGTNLYQAYQKERQHAYTTGSQTDNLSTGTFRSTGLSTTNINQSTGNFTISLDYDGPKGTTNSTGPIGSPITLRINGNPNYVMLMSSWFNNPPANTSTLRNVSWEPTGQVYSIPYPLGTSADLRNVTSLIAEATEVVIPNPAVFSTQAQIAVVGNGVFRGASNQSSAFSTAINAGKNVEIGSVLASQSTISVNAVKVTRTSANLNVAAAQSTANDRIRTTTAALATTAAISIDAVKTTGVVVNAASAVTQTTVTDRIRTTSADFSAFNSQLTAAFKNATGTVLLESVTQMQITAEKNAVGVIAIASAFTQNTDTDDSKIVRISSDLTVSAALSAEALRIQPANADVSAQFTQTTNTDQSKITRVTADFASTVSMTTAVVRQRDGIALQASLGTLSCSIDRLRQANSNLSAVIYDFTASPTFIIRVTAEFTAFNSQLTVGEIINIDPALQLMIEPETRIRKIQQETRVLSIESETRVNIIED